MQVHLQQLTRHTYEVFKALRGFFHGFSVDPAYFFLTIEIVIKRSSLLSLLTKASGYRTYIKLSKLLISG